MLMLMVIVMMMMMIVVVVLTMILMMMMMMMMMMMSPGGCQRFGRVWAKFYSDSYLPDSPEPATGDKIFSLSSDDEGDEDDDHDVVALGRVRAITMRIKATHSTEVQMSRRVYIM
jgi:hypothetical protein